MNPERLQQVEELYHSAREREPDARGSFLVEACRGDEELRREVESLLVQNVSGDVTQLGVGALLGPYQIESPLGAGGMGQVYN
jgi:hypothetical protein